jgi:hypothetical protein
MAELCPFTGEGCQILTDEVTSGQFPAESLEKRVKTAGKECQEGFDMASIHEVEDEIICGLGLAASIRRDFNQREHAVGFGNGAKNA